MNYTKSTNFATKDSLSPGNPLKIVRGTEIDTEFNNIATAVNSKSDSLSPTFTGTVTVAALTATGTATFNGSAVFNGSSTLTAPNLGTPSVLNLTNATALPLTTGVTGTLPIANGGTGATTGAAALTALGLVSASTTAQGIVELATSAEAAAGTDTVLAITPATLFGGLNASGSAPIYAARAWVNFNGTLSTPISPRASGNVSSIVKSGAGDYTINFTTAMPDTNYATVINTNRSSTNTTLVNISRLADELATPTTTAVRIAQGVPDASRGLQREDASIVSVAIFR